MRNSFSSTLVDLAVRDPRLLLLTGDHGYALFDPFRKACPAQYVNAGIAEQNMVGMAAGLARVGFRPIVYGLSAFIPVRVIEQIKLDVAHDDLPVIFTGDGAGFVYSHLGTSHQSTEDIACTRAIPGLTVYSPADRHELVWAMNDAYASGRPAYIRMGKSDRGDVHSETPSISTGQLLCVSGNPSSSISVLATGSMVKTAQALGAQLPELDISVWSVPAIKPIDQAQVVQICRSSNAVIVLEEHSVYGGLAGLIAEIAGRHAPVRILPVGVSDRFSHYCGTYDYLLREHGLDIDSIVQRVHAFLAEATISPEVRFK